MDSREYKVGQKFTDGGRTFVVDSIANGYVYSHCIGPQVVEEVKETVTEEKPVVKAAPKKPTTTRKTTKKK